MSKRGRPPGFSWNGAWRMNNNPNWKGGWKINKGYKMVRVEGRGYVREHRIIMEVALGRVLNLHEVVHHVNGDRLDNRLKNLRLMDPYRHGSYHRAKQVLPPVSLITRAIHRQDAEAQWKDPRVRRKRILAMLEAWKHRRQIKKHGS